MTSDETFVLDGSTGDQVERPIVVWRRLEAGDERSPGTELAPESAHIEAKILHVAIGRERHTELQRLGRARAEALGRGDGLGTRYQPAGVLFALGGGLAFAAWLDYVRAIALPIGGALMLAGIVIGVVTRIRKNTHDARTRARWNALDERTELEQQEKELGDAWTRFAEKVKEDGFRTDLRVGDLDEADRLVSIDTHALADPETWLPPAQRAQIRYGAVLPGGRVVERLAELENEPDAS